MGQKLTKQDVRDAVQHAFEQTKAVTGGKNADYIPYLANVPSDLFGIAVCPTERLSPQATRNTSSASNRYRKCRRPF